MTVILIGALVIGLTLGMLGSVLGWQVNVQLNQRALKPPGLRVRPSRKREGEIVSVSDSVGERDSIERDAGKQAHSRRAHNKRVHN
ncbi:MAG: hypothetical protein AAGA03_14260 [Planctomycetota bacterium]